MDGLESGELGGGELRSPGGEVARPGARGSQGRLVQGRLSGHEGPSEDRPGHDGQVRGVRSTGASAAGVLAKRTALPVRSLLEEVGEMMILAGKTVSAVVRPPYPYGGEFVWQFLFALRVCWLPLLVSTFAISYGAPGLQAANF